MTFSPNQYRSGAPALAGIALAAVVAAVAGCTTTESLDGAQRPQAAATARPAAFGPILGTGY